MIDENGLDGVLRRFNETIHDIERSIVVGVKKAGDHILEKTIPITPISKPDGTRRGDLRKSGKVKIEKINGVIDAVVSFGDGRVNYALRVHEMPTETNWSEPGTGNKYLEKTIRKEKERINRIIANEVDL